jgi:oligopeptide transport system ATP-binding protein
MSVVRHISQRIGVMYLGRLVELATSDQLHQQPLHPYTQALLSAAPIPDPIHERQRQRIILKGEVPSPDRHYAGCQFADRCPIAEGYCRESSPRLKGLGHKVACFKVET